MHSIRRSDWWMFSSAKLVWLCPLTGRTRISAPTYIDIFDNTQFLFACHEKQYKLSHPMIVAFELFIAVWPGENPPLLVAYFCNPTPQMNQKKISQNSLFSVFTGTSQKTDRRRWEAAEHRHAHHQEARHIPKGKICSWFLSPFMCSFLQAECIFNCWKEKKEVTTENGQKFKHKFANAQLSLAEIVYISIFAI